MDGEQPKRLFGKILLDAMSLGFAVLLCRVCVGRRWWVRLGPGFFRHMDLGGGFRLLSVLEGDSISRYSLRLTTRIFQRSYAFAASPPALFPAHLGRAFAS